MITAPKIGDRVWAFSHSREQQIREIRVDEFSNEQIIMKKRDNSIPGDWVTSVHYQRKDCFPTKQELLDHLSDTAIPLQENKA